MVAVCSLLDSDVILLIKLTYMDSVCPELSALVIFLVIYACTCFVALQYSRDSQAKHMSSDIADSGIESSIISSSA